MFIRPVIGPSGGSAPAVLFYDSFTDTLGTSLPSHTPDVDTVGGGWTNNSESQTISETNTATENATNSASISSVDTGQADVVIEATINQGRASGASGGSGVLFRFTDTNNYWMAVGLSTGTNPWTWTIYKMEGGSGGSVVDAQGTTGGDAIISDVPVKITLSGTDIRFEMPSEGIDLSTTSSFNETATRHGTRLFRSSGGLVPQLDELTIVQN